MELKKGLFGAMAYIGMAGVGVTSVHADIGLRSSMTSAQGNSNLISSGTYRLHNHPDGAPQPPRYGMRLDGLEDLAAGHDVFTFSFDELANGDGADAAMFIDIDMSGGTVRIFGRTWGGRVLGGMGAYDPGNSGYWDVDFTYTTGVSSPIAIGGGNLDNDLAVFQAGGFPPNANNGTITRAFADADFDPSYTLWDFSGSHTINGMSYSFRLGNENNDLGHRGFDGISGWGWMNHSGNLMSHVGATDWLFTMETNPIPAPGAMVLGCIGFAIVSAVARRAKQR